MSEEIKKTAEGISIDAEFTISVSGGFYSRLHDLLGHLRGMKTFEEYMAALENIKKGEPKDTWEDQVLTVLTLIAECEKEATKQGKVQQVPILDKTSSQ